MKSRNQIILASAVLLAFLVVFVGKYVGIWAARSAYKETVEPNLGKLSELLGTATYVALADSRPPAEATPKNSGVVDYYKNNPGELKRDRERYRTWHTAFKIANELIKRHQSMDWTSSSQLPWLPTEQRADGWGHVFCVKFSEEEALIISPGPDAVSSLNCTDVKISPDQIRNLKPLRLNPVRSGALIYSASEALPQN